MHTLEKILNSGEACQIFRSAKTNQLHMIISIILDISKLSTDHLRCCVVVWEERVLCFQMH